MGIAATLHCALSIETKPPITEGPQPVQYPICSLSAGSDRNTAPLALSGSLQDTPGTLEGEAWPLTHTQAKPCELSKLLFIDCYKVDVWLKGKKKVTFKAQPRKSTMSSGEPKTKESRNNQKKCILSSDCLAGSLWWNPRSVGARRRAKEERKTNSSKASFPTRLKVHSRGRLSSHSQAGPSILRELQARDGKKSVFSVGQQSATDRKNWVLPACTFANAVCRLRSRMSSWSWNAPSLPHCVWAVLWAWLVSDYTAPPPPSTMCLRQRDARIEQHYTKTHRRGHSRKTAKN